MGKFLPFPIIGLEFGAAKRVEEAPAWEQQHPSEANAMAAIVAAADRPLIAAGS
jgi:hypothetical protein